MLNRVTCALTYQNDENQEILGMSSDIIN